MLWLPLLVIALICLHALIRLHNRRERNMLAHLPTYSCLPFIGNGHWFVGDGKRAVHHLRALSRIVDEKRLPFVIWVGQRCVIFLSDLEESKIVANTFIEKPSYYRFADVWVKNGLITAPGYIWKRNVKKIKSTINGAMVDGFQEIFNDKAEMLVKLLKNETNAKPFDLMHKYLALIALEAIFRTAISNSVEKIATQDFNNALQRLLQLIFHRSINIFLHPEVIYRLTPAYREMKHYMNIVNNVTENVLKTKRMEREKKKENTPNIKKTTNTELDDQPFKPFLDTLIEMSETDKTLTDSQIEAEMNTIILAGQETVTTALNFVFLMLGSKRDVQQKVYEEVKEVFGDSKHPVRKEDLARLRYCEAVICETMRLYPPVPGALRLADRDLELGSCTIPKGATCVLFLWGLAHSEHLWKDAYSYQPERWLQPNSESALLNFSIGRRACIGKRYAMALMKTIMVYCVREFEFTSEGDKMVLTVNVSMRPVSGHLLSVRLRNNKDQTNDIHDRTNAIQD